MKKFRNALWGLALVAVGVLWGLNALGITSFNITLINGWWTLFIIVPCVIGLFCDKDKTGSIIGIIVGAVLFLCCQNILDFGSVWKLAIPFLLVVFGISFIIKDTFHRRTNKEIHNLNENIDSNAEYCATFSGQNVNFDGEEFKGAKITAVFGGVKCDLRNAIINENQVVNCTAVFGGIDVYVPNNVKVKVKSTSIFGGVSDKKLNNVDENSKVIYINASCMFGGVEIK